MMKRLNMPVFFMSHGVNPDFAHFGDPARNMVRLYWNPRPVTADEAYEEIRSDQLKRWWDRGYRRFVFFNEPQIKHLPNGGGEGMGIAWHSKEEFALYLKHCLQRAQNDLHGIKLYTTPMTSNAAFDPWGWRSAMWRQVKDLVEGWCIHAYTGNNADADAAAQDIADQIKQLKRKYRLQIPIVVSEASVNRGDNAAQKAQVARLLPRKLARVSGIDGVFWYAADWNPEFDTHHEGWFRNGIADAFLQQGVLDLFRDRRFELGYLFAQAKLGRCLPTAAAKQRGGPADRKNQEKRRRHNHTPHVIGELRHQVVAGAVNGAGN